MDMLKTLQAAAKNLSIAQAHSPIGEFALLAVLLTSLQLGLGGIGPSDSAREPTRPLAVNAVQPQATLSAVQAIDLVNNLVDKINNPAFPIELSTYTISTRDTSTPAVFTQRLPSALTQSKPALINFTAAAKSAQSKYRFNNTVKQPIFNAPAANPFNTDNSVDSKIAIWRVNKKFALAAKRSSYASRKRAKSNHKFVIMLDPGHGGSDPGSVGHNGLKEKVLTLDIAKRAERLLSKDHNISVVLTRNNDTGLSRKERVHSVKHSNADMVVSLHLNHLPEREVNLVETFYAAPHNILESIEKQRSEKNVNGLVKTTARHNHDFAFTQGSKQLASLMQKRVFAEVIDHNPNTDNAGVKQDTLYILTRSFTPGVLIELSCLSNEQEANRLSSPAYRERLAAALASGIRDYLATPAAQRQFGPEV